MLFTKEEVFDYVRQEDVKFIRLAFCDANGVQKNLAIMPSELEGAFEEGMPFNASAIDGFGHIEKSDLLLFPVPWTLTVLPWRPSAGRVVRLFCDVKYPDGTPFEKDSRYILKEAAKKANAENVTVEIGSEFEFYLFKTDEDGNPTKEPMDQAGYMDISPKDRGETVRREICLAMLDMDIHPQSSHHEEGPGQNEIDFLASDPLHAADNAVNFKSSVDAAALHNGLYADFSPKPLDGQIGNSMHIKISIADRGMDKTEAFAAGIMEHIKEITAFLNPCEESYKRLGEMKAPTYITWSSENRSQLIRIPKTDKPCKNIILRSPDPMSNPYIAYALLIHAGLDGIERGLQLPSPVDINLFDAEKGAADGIDTLPKSLKEAKEIAANSEFVKKILPESYL